MGTKWEQEHQSADKNGNKVGTMREQEHPKWDKNGNKVGTKWEQEHQSGTRMGTKLEQSGNKNPKVGKEWEQSGGTRTPKWDKNGNRTKWEQSGNKNTKVGQEWEQSGNKNAKVGQEWEQSWNKVGTRAQKWDKNGNKVGTRIPKWDKNENKTREYEHCKCSAQLEAVVVVSEESCGLGRAVVGEASKFFLSCSHLNPPQLRTHDIQVFHEYTKLVNIGAKTVVLLKLSSRSVVCLRVHAPRNCTAKTNVKWLKNFSTKNFSSVLRT